MSLEREGAPSEYNGEQESGKSNKKYFEKKCAQSCPMVPKSQMRWELRSDYWVEQEYGH